MVYEGTRLTAAAPTRLFEDAETTQEWRDAGFHPVLNERDQSMAANLEAGLIARLLQQKERHPLPDQVQLEGLIFRLIVSKPARQLKSTNSTKKTTQTGECHLVCRI